MFIEVKLVISNAPLSYVYPNTIKIYLAPNHLLFDRQLLCYSNTILTVVRDLTVLSSTADKINHISNLFWPRWRHEYEVNLCETQRASKLNINSQRNYVVSVYDEKVLRHFWRISIVTGLLPSRDSGRRGAILEIKKSNANLKRLINKVFPTEYTYHATNQTDKAREQKLRPEAAATGELKRKYDC